MFYQIKCVRKKEQVPVWRRMLIPAGITFAELALLCGQVLDSGMDEGYEFEFFPEKLRLVEWQEAEEFHDRNFSYYHAPDTFIDDYFQAGKAFTLRNRLKAMREYRVEIEKAIPDPHLPDGSLPDHPLLLKEKAAPDQPFARSAEEVNRVFFEKFRMIPTDPAYPSLEELRAMLDAEQGFPVCPQPQSRLIRRSKSVQEIIRETAETIQKALYQKVSAELRNSLEFDPETGHLLTSPDKASEQVDRLAGKLESLMLSKIHEELSGNEEWKQALRYNMQTEDLADVMEEAYSLSGLKDLAGEIGFSPTGKRKAQIIKELSEYMLREEVMRTRLLLLSPPALAAFEKALTRGCFKPDKSERELLTEAVDLDYMAEYTDGSLLVPRDVAVCFRKFAGADYREFHREASWIVSCLRAFSLMYIAGPVDLLYRIVCRRPSVKLTLPEFMSFLDRIPESVSGCRIQDHKVIAVYALKNNAYRLLERAKRNIPPYLPSEEEILAYSRDGYPSCEAAYRNLLDYYIHTLHTDRNQAVDLCRAAFVMFCTEESLSDYVDFLTQNGITFRSERQFERLMQLAVKANNNTRMAVLQGHKPDEVHAFFSSKKPAHPPTLIPMSSQMADILRENREELDKMGIRTDLDSVARTIPVMQNSPDPAAPIKISQRKVYPNDPCPCGSGKKYKKCCGRNR